MPTTVFQYDVYHSEVGWGDELFKNRLATFSTKEDAEEFRDKLLVELGKHSQEGWYALHIDCRVVVTDVDPASFRPVREVEMHGTVYLPERDASVEIWAPSELRICSVKNDAMKALVAGGEGWAVSYWNGSENQYFTDADAALKAIIEHEKVVDDSLDFSLNLFVCSESKINPVREMFDAALVSYMKKAA